MSEYIFEIGVREHGGAYEHQREEIVRCRDCEYQDEPWNCAAPYSKEPNGFCFWAERKVES